MFHGLINYPIRATPDPLVNRSAHAFGGLAENCAFLYVSLSERARAEKWKHVPATGEKSRKTDVAAPR